MAGYDHSIRMRTVSRDLADGYDESSTAALRPDAPRAFL